jgi:hypothetical protein
MESDDTHVGKWEEAIYSLAKSEEIGELCRKQQVLFVDQIIESFEASFTISSEDGKTNIADFIVKQFLRDCLTYIHTCQMLKHDIYISIFICHTLERIIEYCLDLTNRTESEKKKLKALIAIVDTK